MGGGVGVIVGSGAVGGAVGVLVGGGTVGVEGGRVATSVMATGGATSIEQLVSRQAQIKSWNTCRSGPAERRSELPFRLSACPFLHTVMVPPSYGRER